MVIANPPLNPYKGDFHLGHAFYHVVLDIFSRFSTYYLGESLYCPKFSLNVNGKGADRLIDINSSIETYVQEFIYKANKVQINLSFNEVLRDDSIINRRRAKIGFEKIYENDYLIIDGDNAYLNWNKIRNSKVFLQKFHDLEFIPTNSKKKFQNIIENSPDKILINRSTKYTSISMGLNLGPLFVATFLYDNFNTIKLLPLSYNVLAKYGCLLLAKNFILYDDFRIQSVLIFNRVIIPNDENRWSKHIKNEIDGDGFRYFCAKSFSKKRQKIHGNISLIKSGKTIVLKILSLRKIIPFFKIELIEFNKLFETPSWYVSNMKVFNFSLTLHKLEAMLLSLITEAQDLKYIIIEDKNLLRKKYFSLLLLYRPFFPKMFEAIMNE